MNYGCNAATGLYESSSIKKRVHCLKTHKCIGDHVFLKKDDPH